MGRPSRPILRRQVILAHCQYPLRPSERGNHQTRRRLHLQPLGTGETRLENHRRQHQRGSVYDEVGDALLYQPERRGGVGQAGGYLFGVDQ